MSALSKELDNVDNQLTSIEDNFNTPSTIDAENNNIKIILGDTFPQEALADYNTKVTMASLYPWI